GSSARSRCGVSGDALRCGLAPWRHADRSGDVRRSFFAASAGSGIGVLAARASRDKARSDDRAPTRVRRMAGPKQTTRFRFWRSSVRFIGVIVPRRFRDRFRQEWESELEYREELLARWDRLNRRAKLELLWRSLGAFRDALWLQQLRWEDEMTQDLRFGVRMLLKHRGFTCVAALTLALGIGANTAIFSLIDAVLLKMLPVNNPERLVLLGRAVGGRTGTQFPYRTYRQIRDQNEVLSGLLAYHTLRLSVSVDNQPEPAMAGQLVSGNYYSVLGVNAALGRTIAPDDDRAPGESPVCVISYNYWQRRFAGDSAV